MRCVPPAARVRAARQRKAFTSAYPLRLPQQSTRDKVNKEPRHEGECLRIGRLLSEECDTLRPGGVTGVRKARRACTNMVAESHEERHTQPQPTQETTTASTGTSAFSVAFHHLPNPTTPRTIRCAAVARWRHARYTQRHALLLRDIGGGGRNALAARCRRKGIAVEGGGSKA